VYGTRVDTAHAQDILAHADLILSHMPVGREQPEAWFNPQEEDDPHTKSKKVIHTTVMPDPDHYGGTACIFMQEDYKCALQVAGEEAGMHPWRFKPFYCILHPLDMDDHGRITLDETHLLLAELASCLRPSKKHIPLKETFAEELNFLTKESNKKE
jgi:hypothetical protein